MTLSIGIDRNRFRTGDIVELLSSKEKIIRIVDRKKVLKLSIEDSLKVRIQDFTGRVCESAEIGEYFLGKFFCRSNFYHLRRYYEISTNFSCGG